MRNLGGMTDEGVAQATADYEAGKARIEAAIASCPACKGMKTRKAKAIAAAEGCDQSSYYNPMNRAVNRPEECSEHRSALRCNYVCNPISETYWAS